jgi:hypothetical protein
VSRKNVPPHLFDKAKKCIFCGEPGLSKTHIWPQWINKLLGPPNSRRYELIRPTHRAGSPTEHQLETRQFQGSIFSQKPYLACVDCNTGWMKTFEDEMEKFAKPIFTSLSNVRIASREMQTMAGWAALIATLAEFMDRDRKPVISEAERTYIKNHLKPPATWTVVATTVDDKEWASKYQHRTTFISDYASVEDFKASIETRPHPNTLISTFGMGKLLIQIFVCPDHRFIENFRAFSLSLGLLQLWPIVAAAGPLVSPKNLAQFPTSRRLTDQDADFVAAAYAAKIESSTVVPSRL